MRAALLAVGALAALPGHAAAAPTTTGPIDGRVTALAVAGDALVLVRDPSPGRPRLEVRRPGQPVRVLATLGRDDVHVSLAAGPQGVAVAWWEDGGSYYDEDTYDDTPSPSHVLAGPLSGPLHEVAGCQRALTSAAVALDGTRLAFTDGACTGPREQRAEVGPSALVLADVDPTVPQRRIDLPADVIPTGITLTQDGGTVTVQRPTFGFGATDVRRFGPAGLEPPTRLSGVTAIALGARADGVPAFLKLDFDELDFGGDDSDGCDATVGLLPTGATGLQDLAVGGCPAFGDDDSVPAVLAGDHLAASVHLLQPADDDPTYLVDRGAGITRTPATGGRPVQLASTRYREPGVLGADASRVAWTQARCAGGTEVVTTDVPVGTVPRCSTRVDRRAAQVRGRAVTLRITCARGCSGQLGDDSRCYGRGRSLGPFAFGPGTHRVRVRVRRETLRSGRLLLAVNERGGKRYNRVVLADAPPHFIAS